MSKKRVNFEDLFEITDEGLSLKRDLIIEESHYKIGDIVESDLAFMDNPEKYFYIINPLKVGDTLEGWSPIK